MITSRLRAVAAGTLLVFLFVITPVATFAQTATMTNVSATAAAEAQLTEEQLKEAAAAAAETAKSPELQKATTSLWRNAWNATWPFIKEMASKFFRMLGNVWDKLGEKPDPAGGAYINANITP